MSKHPCRRLLFKLHDLNEETERVVKTLDLDWLWLHCCGISKPWNIYYRTCKRCGEEVCLGGEEDPSRLADYRAHLTWDEYQRLVGRVESQLTEVGRR